MKFVLDNNLPPVFARSLNALAESEPYDVIALRAEVPSFTDDLEWIPHFGGQGNCAVVSGDRRLRTRFHQLQALRQHKLTHLILAPGWSKLTLWNKAWLLVRWWPSIVEMATNAKPGTGFVIPHKHSPSRELPPSRYESDVEAITLFSLAIRHIEGVLVLAREDMVLIPPAYVCARAAFETAIKAAWIVDADDCFEREARWLVHLEEDERFNRRAAKRTQSPNSFNETADTIQQFREGVTRRMPGHVELLKGNPTLEEMSRSIGGELLYSLYIYLSQYVHGCHAASGLYRMHLGTEKKFGEFIDTGHWYIALRLCWLAHSHPG